MITSEALSRLDGLLVRLDGLLVKSPIYRNSLFGNFHGGNILEFYLGLKNV